MSFPSMRVSFSGPGCSATPAPERMSREEFDALPGKKLKATDLSKKLEKTTKRRKSK
jgi:hypothetical protein